MHPRFFSFLLKSSVSVRESVWIFRGFLATGTLLSSSLLLESSLLLVGVDMIPNAVADSICNQVEMQSTIDVDDDDEEES